MTTEQSKSLPPISVIVMGKKQSGKTTLKKLICNQKVSFNANSSSNNNSGHSIVIGGEEYIGNHIFETEKEVSSNGNDSIIFTIADPAGDFSQYHNNNEGEGNFIERLAFISDIFILCVNLSSENPVGDLNDLYRICSQKIPKDARIEPIFMVVGNQTTAEKTVEWEAVLEEMGELGIDTKNSIEIGYRDQAKGEKLSSMVDDLVTQQNALLPERSTQIEEFDEINEANPHFTLNNIPKATAKNCLSPWMLWNGLAIIAGLVIGSLAAAAAQFFTFNPLAATVIGIGVGAATTGSLFMLGCCLFGDKREKTSKEGSPAPLTETNHSPLLTAYN